MPRDGNEILARWRLAGKWWEGESPVEFARYIDAKGVRREATRKLPVLSVPRVSDAMVHEEDHREDILLRL